MLHGASAFDWRVGKAVAVMSYAALLSIDTEPGDRVGRSADDRKEGGARIGLQRVRYNASPELSQIPNHVRVRLGETRQDRF